MEEEISYKVDWCSYCDQGWIEILKDKFANRLFLKCAECETEYENFHDLYKKARVCSHQQYVEPTFQELIEEGWDKYIIDNWKEGHLVNKNGDVVKVWSASENTFIKPRTKNE